MLSLDVQITPARTNLSTFTPSPVATGLSHFQEERTVAIAEKATSRVGETPAPNSKQTETPPIHNTADPASESTPLLPCNVDNSETAARSMVETPATTSKQTETPPIDNTADPASKSTPLLPPESETPASSSLASPISFTNSLSLPVAPSVSTLTQSVLKFSQPSPISSSLASPLPPASILSASSKLNPVSTELGSPDTVSYAQKKRQIKRKTEPKECPIHKDSTSFPYKTILRKRIREWDEVEKHLGATRKYSKFILKMYVL
ncbi:early nodulin 2 [Labeo rohita]|uniref:Early nodulin 2 n=1 Tax=Labeo rohita TaxID=84645 RepID=A0A498LYS6_LABRO|nr:early nodulin 2 [Labeo rohita]